MLEEKDIQKLIEAQKEVFATKEDFKNLKEVFVTKEDFKNLKEVFVTKQDLENLIDIVATKHDMKEGFEKMNNKLDKLVDQEIKPLKERIRKVENALAIE